ncbi:SDR family NAD(P)-dependent oxidoreductase [Frankia sp. AgB1.9]|uniref:SDR family NAD(P)-dependent oxidoreductase n=1 Tax=unclassified Frankia TaxID=2632575 RepID=UPI0019321E2A|nr:MULTISPECIES: SDR family NAD(P)-dependent oxidoreductase [unclassified Frankia]MBL7487229.1 SDR family NAD(P)-dependent oxidoreductase [Frankia sp. AgW1.1]MBL7547975.1 SDR family NAD(P)-dependent oxidoreductase [Frankia sp. AgB1.9]MBL7625032.1 SDR family NAD(P)-dependent oxidoreductase [Frankia sp. AgB1.8]
MAVDHVAFWQRYGPWALVAGASEGVSAAYARAMAERGLNVVLLDHRQNALDHLAASIRAATGVQTRAMALDLSGPYAMAKILDATGGLDVGMLMYYAGAGLAYQPFLDNPLDVPLTMVHRNCVVPMQLCHHFAGHMAARGSGGIVLVSSVAVPAGAAETVAYGASRAFGLVMIEALWAELCDTDVDVLSVDLGATDTAALRRLPGRRGGVANPDDLHPTPGAATPAEIARQAITNLANGPTWPVSENLREPPASSGRCCLP